MFLACWAAAAAAALAFGRDANWDLRHYHLHNAWALLEGRWALDVAPAGEHGFLHPGLDLPFYLLVQGPLNGWPRVVAALQAGTAGLLAFLTLAVCNLACHGEARRATGASALTAAFGLTGAATLPEAGATFNDIQAGCLVLGALLALLLAAGAEDGADARRAARLRLLAGGLGGAAVGLKLTAAVFPPALALAAALAVGPGAAGAARRRARAVALLAAGGLAGFALAYGPWGWFLWERFGNPFGPFFNEVFRSPWFPTATPRDGRFLPDGLGEALVYPLLWARRSEMVVAEPWMADPRFAVALAALAVAAAAGAWRRLRRAAVAGAEAAAGGDADRIARRATRTVLAFVLAAYAGWLGAFAILRYALPVEALLGVAVWAAARAVLPAPPVPTPAAQAGTVPRRRGEALCVGAALAACALGTEYPDWDRRPFGWGRGPDGPAAALAAERIALPEGSLVLLVGGAVSFLAPSLAGPGVRFVGANALTAADPEAARLGAEARRAVRSHAGPAYAVVRDPEPWEDPTHRHERAPARALGLDLDPAAVAACRPLANNLGASVRLCRWR